MKLHEIIEANAKPGTEIELQEFRKYRKSLQTIFENEFKGEPVLMITSIFNAAQYGKIVCAHEFMEAIEDYLNEDKELTEEDREHERELIGFNSKLLKEL